MDSDTFEQPVQSFEQGFAQTFEQVILIIGKTCDKRIPNGFVITEIFG